MPPVESSAYGTPVTEFFLYKKGWYEHDGKPDLHLGGWSKHAFKGHCFVCELKNIKELHAFNHPPPLGSSAVALSPCPA